MTLQNENDALQRAIKHAINGNRAIARIELEEILSDSSESIDAWIWHAWLSDSPAAAIASINKALSLDPNSEVAFTGLTWLEQLQNWEGSRPQAGESSTAAVRQDDARAEDEESVPTATTEPEEVEQVTPEAPADTESSASVEQSKDEVSLEDRDCNFEDDSSSWVSHGEQVESSDEAHEPTLLELDTDEVPLDVVESASSMRPGNVIESVAIGNFEDDVCELDVDEEAYLEQVEDRVENRRQLERSTDRVSDLETDETESQQTLFHWNEAEASEPEFTEASATESETSLAAENEAAYEPKIAEISPPPEMTAEDDEQDEVEVAILNEVCELASEAPCETNEPASDFETNEENAPAAVSEDESLIESAGDGGETSKMMILAVDDSPTVRNLVAMTLERVGYEVITASDGVAALNLLAERRPVLILSDINMPKLSGYKLCKLIKKHPRTRDIPVVMLSGKNGVFDKVRGQMVGCADYITKPFESHDLIEKVRQYTQSESCVSTSAE